MTPVSKTTQLLAKLETKVSFATIGYIFGCILIVAISYAVWRNEYKQKITWKAKYDTLTVERNVFRDMYLEVKGKLMKTEVSLQQANEVINKGKEQQLNAEASVRMAIQAKNRALSKMTEYEQKLATAQDMYLNGDINDQQLKDAMKDIPLFKTPKEMYTAYLKVVAQRDEYKRADSLAQVRLGQQAQQVSDLEKIENKTGEALSEASNTIDDLRGEGQTKLQELSGLAGLFKGGQKKLLRSNDAQYQKAQEKFSEVRKMRLKQ